ncbi:MAG: ABC transporter ATP-binding protein [Candidatus Eiseniibacteriota bacterium]
MSGAPILSLEAVTKRFGGLTVIDDLSVEVPRGARLALIGPNGAGKTTVFNLISGVYPVTSGRIALDGADVTRVKSSRRIRHGVVRSFQNIRLMTHLTAVENVMLGQQCRAGRLGGALQPVGLGRRTRGRAAARAALADAGLEAHADAAIGARPYGVQKRIDLVRALMAEPKLLLLDEPAAGLNATETADLQAQLERVAATGVTMIVVEHDMHFVGAFCDRVVVLNFGRKIAEGRPDAVREHPEVREAYLGSDETEARLAS